MVEIQAEISAAKKTGHRICLMITETAVRFAGYNYLLGFLKEAKQELKGNVLIQLDHGNDLELIKQCISDAFDIIMIDGSSMSFKENVDVARRVVKHAHEKGILIEGAIGKVGNIYKNRAKTLEKATNLKHALEFVSKTNVDFLAISVGNYHGNSQTKPPLNFTLIETLSKEISCPLVLHGADFIDSEQLKEAIRLGIQKINFGPEIRYAYWNSLESSLKELGSDDPRDVFAIARNEIQEAIEKRINELL